MTDVYLHGFGSSGSLFREVWETARPVRPDSLFPDGYQSEPLTGRFRWFPLSGAEAVLARHVAAAADRLSTDLAVRIRADAIRLFGHSQGGMIALELVRRGELPVVFAEVFAAYLPLSESTRAWRGKPSGVVIHASGSDPYIASAQVRRTVAEMTAVGIPVRSRLLNGMPHGFSPDWLASAKGVAA